MNVTNPTEEKSEMDYGSGLQNTPMIQQTGFAQQADAQAQGAGGRPTVITAITQSDLLVKMIGETAGRLVALATALGGPQPEKSGTSAAAPPASGALDALNQKLAHSIDGMGFVLGYVARLEKLVA